MHNVLIFTIRWKTVEISNRFPMARDFFWNTFVCFTFVTLMKAVFPHTKTLFRITEVLWRENNLRLFAISMLTIRKIFKSRILHDRHGREVWPCSQPSAARGGLRLFHFVKCSNSFSREFLSIFPVLFTYKTRNLDTFCGPF